MLTPEPMLHVSIVALERDLEAVTRAVATVGVLHLLDVRHSIGTLATIRPYDVRDRLAHLDAVAHTLQHAATFLGMGGNAPPAAAADDTRSVADIEARVSAIASEVDALRQEHAAAAADLERLTALQRHLRALAPMGVPLDGLRGLRYVTVASGLLPAANLPRLRESLTGIPHLVVAAGPVSRDGRQFITALCLRPVEDVLDRALRGAQLERLEVPSHLAGTPDELAADVEHQLGERRTELDRLDSSRRTLGLMGLAEIRALAARIERERLLVQARGHMGRSERVALVTGWVPTVLRPRVEKVAREATLGRCVLHWSEPTALDAVRRGHVLVPILLRNPVLIRPFEQLLRNYGLPQYGELEPTAIMALTFLLMFGFMFGDVGQGAVLFALGFFMYRRTFRYRDYAIILMECGTSGIVFGFLYGSVFGVEHWLPALWLRPMDDMPTLIRTAITFGAILLSVGFALNLANAWRRRDWAALWARNGLFAAVAYWTAVGLLMRRLIGGPDAVTVGMAILCLSVPLGLILLKDPATSLWRALRAGERPQAGEVFGALVEAAVEVLDTLICTVSNTATFIRLAAFALSHAGLFLAIFSLADVAQHSGAGTVGAAIVLVLGNVLIIALEGLIVSIQGVRLEYYEFFSKFYSGGGEEYRPLRVATAPSGAS